MVKTYLSVKGRPTHFSGSLRLPPSKSYLHRALFVAATASTSSEITNCGEVFSDDMIATMNTLKAFGVKIIHSPEDHGTLHLTPGKTHRQEITLDAMGSGTTARFAVSFAALAGERTITRLTGDNSLSRRPMQEIYDALSQLGVGCRYGRKNGHLPILIEGGGIEGGRCEVDGSISSQFISSLLISCTQAQSNCKIRLLNPSRLVSIPYIEATLRVLSAFGFKIKTISSPTLPYLGFEIKGNQKVNGRRFSLPGDMSTAAALIGAAIASRGNVRLLGVNKGLPQSDSVIVRIARKFGARIRENKASLSAQMIESKHGWINFSLANSPDIVPVVVGLSAAMGRGVGISEIGHLRFKESDRLSVLSRELTKLGLKTSEGKSSIQVSGEMSPARQIRKPIVLDPDRDHRMLMALTIAGLSGRFGELRIKDPDCVKKSYPSFVSDLQKLCHEKQTLKLVNVK